MASFDLKDIKLGSKKDICNSFLDVQGQNDAQS